MRRAIPYPCSGPRTSSVFRTINANVPCRTSAFCFITDSVLYASPQTFSFVSQRLSQSDVLVPHRKIAILPLGKQQVASPPPRLGLRGLVSPLTLFVAFSRRARAIYLLNELRWVFSNLWRWLRCQPFTSYCDA